MVPVNLLYFLLDQVLSSPVACEHLFTSGRYDTSSICPRRALKMVAFCCYSNNTVSSASLLLLRFYWLIRQLFQLINFHCRVATQYGSKTKILLRCAAIGTSLTYYFIPDTVWISNPGCMRLICVGAPRRNPVNGPVGAAVATDNRYLQCPSFDLRSTTLGSKASADNKIPSPTQESRASGWCNPCFPCNMNKLSIWI